MADKPNSLGKQRFNTDSSTWENTSMEQISLMPGTPEYEEYVRDLKEHDPFREDDKMHTDLEAHNEAHQEVLRDKAKEAVQQPTAKRKYRNMMAKEVQIDSIRRQAKLNAEKTDTEIDDRKAESRKLPEGVEKMMQNDGISEDEFLPKALRKYE